MTPKIGVLAPLKQEQETPAEQPKAHSVYPPPLFPYGPLSAEGPNIWNYWPDQTTPKRDK